MDLLCRIMRSMTLHLQICQMPNNSTTVYNGTATITMRQGPVPDVPVSIKAMENNAVSIWVDPTKIQNHFGNTPIFGTIEKLLEVAK